MARRRPEWWRVSLSLGFWVVGRGSIVERLWSNGKCSDRVEEMAAPYLGVWFGGCLKLGPLHPRPETPNPKLLTLLLQVVVQLFLDVFLMALGLRVLYAIMRRETLC